MASAATQLTNELATNASATPSAACGSGNVAVAASWPIDTTLLTAALMLVTILHQYPFVHAWLTAKVLLLVVYIVLGTFALKRGRTRRVQVACYFCALFVFAFIVSIARAHDAWGLFGRFVH
jgi:hypothetical protein